MPLHDDRDPGPYGDGLTYAIVGFFVALIIALGFILPLL